MNIHEYQAKQLLEESGVPVPLSIVASTPLEAVRAAEEISKRTGVNDFAVKAQIHSGGRGKGGGVKIAHSIDEVQKYAEQIIGMNLVTHQTGPSGKRVKRVLIQQGVYQKGASEVKEYYISILLNRTTGRNMIIYSPQGGMDIEAVAVQTPDLIYKEEIHPLGLQLYQAKKIALRFGLKEKALIQMLDCINSLYNAYIKNDLSLLEVNPLVKTSGDEILAVDAKVNIDDNALFRHPELALLRDKDQEDPSEVEASDNNLNFVKLDGNVGCMVNGAGLAMATMDIIKLSGGEPANFLDVGGSANAKTVSAGFRIILKDPNVNAILINIFGGIVRCDRVAQGIVDAYKEVGNIQLPVIVRLQGTNARDGKMLIDGSGLKVKSAISLQEAADLVRSVV